MTNTEALKQFLTDGSEEEARILLGFIVKRLLSSKIVAKIIVENMTISELTDLHETITHELYLVAREAAEADL